MIEQIAYLALLNAPEIASGTASLAGNMVEAVGRRFAAGVYQEVSDNLKRDTKSVGSLLFGGLVDGWSAGLAEDFKGSAGKLLSSAMQGEGVTLVSTDELALLRKLAADAAAGNELQEGVAALKRFYKGKAQG